MRYILAPCTALSVPLRCTAIGLGAAMYQQPPAILHLVLCRYGGARYCWLVQGGLSAPSTSSSIPHDMPAVTKYFLSPQPDGTGAAARNRAASLWRRGCGLTALSRLGSWHPYRAAVPQPPMCGGLVAGNLPLPDF